MYSEWRIDRMSRLKRALALRSVLNGFRAGRHSWIVVSVIESGVLAGMPSRQRSGGGVRRGVTGSASISAAASARASGTVPTVSAFVFQESGRSHARAYRWHRQLQSVVPGRARFRVSKRRFTAIVVVVVVVVAAAPVRRSLRNEISVGAVDDALDGAVDGALLRSRDAENSLAHLCSFPGDSSSQGGLHLFPSWTLLRVQVQARYERRKGYGDRYHRQYPQSLQLPCGSSTFVSLFFFPSFLATRRTRPSSTYLVNPRIAREERIVCRAGILKWKGKG